MKIQQVHEPIAFFNGAMPTGVTISHKGRIFINFPKWGDDVKFTVIEIHEGNIVPYPNESINKTNQEVNKEEEQSKR